MKRRAQSGAEHGESVVTAPPDETKNARDVVLGDGEPGISESPALRACAQPGAFCLCRLQPPVRLGETHARSKRLCVINHAPLSTRRGRAASASKQLKPRVRNLTQRKSKQHIGLQTL